MNIKLRQYRLSDLERVCKIFRDDSVLENLATPLKAKEISKEDEKKWLKGNILSYKEKTPESYNLAIIADGNYVGNIGTPRVDHKKKTVEIGYWIGKPYWGKGIVSQAVRKFVKHITNRFELKEIRATPFSYNKASQRVLEKAGFEYEGEKKKALKKHGKWIDEKIYVIKLK